MLLHAALLLVLHDWCHHLVIPREFPGSEAAPFKVGCPEEFPAPAQAEGRQMSSGRAELGFSQEMILLGTLQHIMGMKPWCQASRAAHARGMSRFACT